MTDSPEQTPLNPASDPAVERGAADLHLQTYADADDLATRYFETPRPPPLWLVQVSMFERPSMTREQLLDELQNGLVRESTLVWRTGMRDWCAVAQVEELRRALPLHLMPRASNTLRKARNTAFAWLCGAAALVTLSVTLYALSAAGVFERGARAAAGARPSSVAASLRTP